MISDSGAFSSFALPVPTSVGLLMYCASPSLRSIAPDEHPLQPVVLERHLVSHLDDRRVAIERQVRQQEAPVAVEHLQIRVGVGDDLAQEGVDLT